MKATIEVDGESFEVTLEQTPVGWEASVGDDRFPVGGRSGVVAAGAHRFALRLLAPDTARIDGVDVPFRIIALEGVAGVGPSGAGGHGPIHPPMTGRLDSIAVTVGQEVAAGDVLFVLEAMKMRNEVRAAAAGVVQAVHMQAGGNVDAKTPVLTITAP